MLVSLQQGDKGTISASVNDLFTHRDLGIMVSPRGHRKPDVFPELCGLFSFGV